MRFKTEFVPWINEVKSYLKNGSTKIGEIKKILKSVDLDNLDYVAKVKLSTLFDPRNEISEEIFKRELDLYFGLLENKTAPIKLPVFSDYIDWVYSQELNHLNDSTFYLISSRLFKSSAKEFSDAIYLFLSRLPAEFNKEIDNLSNSRLNTLINILNETKYGYDDMPEEYKNFIKRMFVVCSVKTEITEKNQYNFRGLFKANPSYYFSIFNKAFAGVGEFESWIDDPAKRLNLRNMINYANFQEKVLANVKYGLKYSNFASCADDLHLPSLPEYDSDSIYFKQYYLRQPRDYIPYAKKMNGLFVRMIRSEVKKAAEAHENGTLSEKDLSVFAVTHRAKNRFAHLPFNGSTKAFERELANELISMVHLDELSGLSYKEIYAGETEQKSQKPVSKHQTKGEVNKTTSYNYHSYDVYQNTLEDRIENGCCETKDLAELYEMYNELLAQGKRNMELESLIFDLEVRKKEEQENEESEEREME